MPQIRPILSSHHRHCDELFSVAEEYSQNGDWPACATATERFARQMLTHFDAEESLLFPAFENATGMTQGPSRVMRMEHGQIRELLLQLNAALLARDAATYAGVAETLLILMQQHNMKEENILYPMCDESLAAQAEGLSAELDNLLKDAECPISA
jgi:hemerythrin-like domain-containing protein